ncbi:MoaD/ThiS family protein [Caenimonas koreensis]|uniref:Molybdopterin synthase sulfur carrier subunit n=1 Tax=Caenimonas koreensis DSM 17982 TaxID=1121255 RepID=A0A844AXZ3_9BURK|nr:MoaD/ThiS family protein [Caenimonas koreensis]MRD45942.1 molybdopterin synthase sulfur carrier subunit [Caenimonas koreensis DSM 17982]
MKISIRYFASIREAVGSGSELAETSAQSIGALRAELITRGGAFAQALAPGKSVRASLDKVMADDAALLREGCEVGFFPPVTGG